MPLHCATALAGYARGEGAATRAYWRDTRLRLPSDIPGRWLDLLSGRQHAVTTLTAADLLHGAPVALCVSPATVVDPAREPVPQPTSV
ncbi:hypothetical protein WJ972_13700 [Achromobacter insuavis]